MTHQRHPFQQNSTPSPGIVRTQEDIDHIVLTRIIAMMNRCHCGAQPSCGRSFCTISLWWIAVAALILLPLLKGGVASTSTVNAITGDTIQQLGDEMQRKQPSTWRPHTVSLLTGWTAFQRQHLTPKSSKGLSNRLNTTNATNSSANDYDDAHALNVPSLPTTALLVLLDNHKIQAHSTRSGVDGNEHQTLITSDNLYHSNNMALLPDIASTGRGYYTLRYEREIPALDTQTLTRSNLRQTLRIAGIHYRSSATLDGDALIPLVRSVQHATSPTIIDGMFRRRTYDVTQGGTFSVQVEPPLHPGKSSNSRNRMRGQGGDHSMAQDGPVPQFVQGWDWIQPMPDRSTGFYGPIKLHTSGIVAILDPCVQTLKIDKANDAMNIQLLLRLEVLIPDGSAPDNDQFDSASVLGDLVVSSDWGEHWSVEVNMSAAIACDHPGLYIIDVTHPVHIEEVASKRIKLWWPHDMSPGPSLHSFDFSFHMRHHPQHNADKASGQGPRSTAESNADDAAVNANANVNIQVHGQVLIHDEQTLSDTRTIQVGLRTIETFVDQHTQGQQFLINGEKLYILGGNWITTDATFRYSASRSRYCNELRLHRHAGLNLVRVWGGGVAETDPFYDCADRLGILIFQEFWMTGDNNGRWAGNYSWPSNHKVYLDNVEDTVMRLRGHASLLFYGGCNECLGASSISNPPAGIDAGIRTILQNRDPGRFYIPSSMGGRNKADTSKADSALWFDRSFSLAFADGPYGMLFPQTFYERNPGLFDAPDERRWKQVRIGFQPEVGSASFPTYRGLNRFLTEEEIEGGMPSGANQPATGAWSYHNYESWTTQEAGNGHDLYDHVYAYHYPPAMHINGTRLTPRQWCAASQLAAYTQYQHLINGFLSHMLQYTTAVIIWKTQSPWPSMRGFMYDSYLESNGMLRGIKAALQRPLSVLLDMKTWELKVIDRRVATGPRHRARKSLQLLLEYAWYNLDGEAVTRGPFLLEDGSTSSAMTARRIPGGRIAWPSNCSSVCFLALDVEEQPHTSESGDSKMRNAYFKQWYWLADPSNGSRSDFSPLTTQLKQIDADGIQLAVRDCGYHLTSMDLQLVVEVEVHLNQDVGAVLLYPTASIFHPCLMDCGMLDETMLRLGDTRRQLLPVLDSNDTEDMVQLPGTTVFHQLIAPLWDIGKETDAAITVDIELDGFNLIEPATLLQVVCMAKVGNGSV